MFIRWITALLCLHSAFAHAAMTLGQTRVIVTETGREATIQVRNADRLPLLLQTWVNTGQEARSAPPAGTVPFVVDPPVMRLEPGQSRAIRVVWVPDAGASAQAALPTDRESLFWLNVLEVVGMDPQEEAGDQHRLEVSVLSRIKLFYRPRAVAQGPGAARTADSLRFTLLRDGQDLWLEIDNPGAIHQTLGTATLHVADTELTLDAPMLEPFAQRRIRAAELPTAFSSARLVFTLIDDDGNVLAHTQELPLMTGQTSPQDQHPPHDTD